MLYIASSLLFLATARLTHAFAPVDIVNGPITGMVIEADTELQQPIRQDVEAFFGIRFAEAPLGDLRFKAPAPYTSQSWTEAKDMTTKGEMCRQPSGKIVIGDEDCLFLNVYRPVASEAAVDTKLPVMVWFYGGGFIGGDALVYNGTALAAEHNSIVVTVNYRVGHIGFFGSAGSLSAEGTTGNWGTLDQQLGLKWVQENIEAFGGDRDRVLLFGESAGAFSVMWHVAAPGSKGLFHAAIMESGTSSTPLFFQHTEDAYKYYDWVATELAGCANADDMECLRAADASQLDVPAGIRFDAERAPTWGSPIFPVMPVGPIVDGYVLPGIPIDVINAGNHNKVPLITGVNRHEGSAFVLMLSKVVPNVHANPTMDDIKTGFQAFLQDTDAVDYALEHLYPYDKYSSGPYGEKQAPFETLAAVMRDAIFHCPARRLADAMTKAGDDVYMYSFEKEDIWGLFGAMSLGALGLPDNTLNEIGSFHSAEIPFVFKSFSEDAVDLSGGIGMSTIHSLYMGHPPRKIGDDFHVLSDSVTCMWANMAVNGSPTDGIENTHCPAGHSNVVSWPRYNDKQEFMHLDNIMSVNKWRQSNTYPDSEMPSMDVCDWWAQHTLGFHDLRSDVAGTAGTTTTLAPAEPSAAAGLSGIFAVISMFAVALLH